MCTCEIPTDKTHQSSWAKGVGRKPEKVLLWKVSVQVKMLVLGLVAEMPLQLPYIVLPFWDPATQTGS